MRNFGKFKFGKHKFGDVSQGVKIGIAVTLLIVAAIISYFIFKGTPTTTPATTVKTPATVTSTPTVATTPTVTKSAYTKGPDKTACRTNGVDNYGASNPLGGVALNQAQCEDKCYKDPNCKAYEINGANDYCWLYGDGAVPFSFPSAETGHYCVTKN